MLKWLSFLFVVIFSVASGENADAQTNPTEPVVSVISPDGNRLISAGNFSTGSGVGFIRILNATTLQPISITFQQVGAVITTADWSPDGKKIVAGDMNGVIRVWNVFSGDPNYSLGQVVATLASSGIRINTVAWSLDGSKIAVGTENDLRIWSVNTSYVFLGSYSIGFVRALGWNPNSTILAVGSYAGGLIFIDDFSNFPNVNYDEVLVASLSVNSLDWNSNGTRIAVGLARGKVSIYDSGSRARTGRFQIHQNSSPITALT